jgi:hypothetical protein
MFFIAPFTHISRPSSERRSPHSTSSHPTHTPESCPSRQAHQAAIAQIRKVQNRYFQEKRWFS